VRAEPQSIGQAMDVDETDVPPSPFATADIRTVKVSRICEFRESFPLLMRAA